MVGIGSKVGLFIQFFAAFIAGFVIAFIYGWELALVIVAVSPLLAISGGVMAKVSYIGHGKGQLYRSCQRSVI